MNRIVLLALSISFVCTILGFPTASAAVEPFAELAELTKDRVRWHASTQEIAASFNAERDRLGTDFEAAVVKFCADDADRAYWCGLFLTANSYLHKRPPLRLLAVALWEQGILDMPEKFLPGAGEQRSFHKLLAIEYARLGFGKLASHHKACDRYLFEEFDEGGPATDSDGIKVYEAIKPLESTVAGRKPAKTCCSAATNSSTATAHASCSTRPRADSTKSNATSG